jgi:hypothetical protein
MNQVVSILGYIVVVGYILKIFFQMYLKHKANEELNLGPNNTIGWEYWKPIKMVEGSRLNALRKIFNFIHILSIVYLVLLIIKVLFIKSE